MVLVRVIVRDAHGDPVTGLTQKDFELTDDHKRQSILYFDAEASAPPPPLTTKESAPTSLAETAPGDKTSPAAAPEKFTAFFFDDYHMEFGDIVQIREAAQRFLAKAVNAGARAAIFTASGKPTVEFTGDRAKLLQGISELHFDRRFGPTECPRLQPYFAQMVVEDVAMQASATNNSRGNPQAGPDVAPQLLQESPIQLAEVMAGQQRCPVSGPFADQDIQSRARNLIFQYGLGVQETLVALNSAVQKLAQTPGGVRTLAMVSGGFFGKNQQSQLDKLIDNALRLNVVVNTLDARGLFAEPPGGPLSELPLTPEIQVKIDEMDHKAKQSDADALNEVAEGTGGIFIQNTNDMEGGLASVGALQTPSYVLGFSPENLKPDGRFHTLHVKLADSSHYTVQARRGYFAPAKGGPSENVQREQMELALFSQDTINGVPIHVSTNFKKSAGADGTLNVTVDADMRSVQFRKEDGRNADDITLTVIVFDPDGNYVAAKQQTTKLRLTDADLQGLRRIGGETSVDVALKPGNYVLRAVLGENSSNQLGAVSQNVKIP